MIDNLAKKHEFWGNTRKRPLFVGGIANFDGSAEIVAEVKALMDQIPIDVLCQDCKVVS